MTLPPDLLKIASPEKRAEMLEAVRASFDFIPDKVNDLLVSEWAVSRRTIPSGLTSRPGHFDWINAPYFREVVDCLSESSDVREVVVMKGARIGYNVDVIENHMGYMIEMCPGPAMFVGANKEQAQTVTELRIDRMIESSGLSGRIASQTTKRANKKQGDTKTKKEFAGGYLLVGGPSGPFLRGTDARYLYLDELDEWKLQVGGREKKSVTANQGDPVGLARRRTGAYPLTSKTVYGSTPLNDSTSKIKALFEEGDQCRYWVPCPKCGRMQILQWRDDSREADDRFRLKFETDSDGRLIYDQYKDGKPVEGTGRVWYECADRECRHRWKNADKLTFLSKGEWRPAVDAEGRYIQARTPHLRSFHISSLYSAIEPWENIVLEWLKIGDDQNKLRQFINTFLGETWKEKGIRPPIDNYEKNRDGYKVGTLPESARPLLITIGADIQEDRIAAEVVAWGRGKESWSIEYHEFPGDTNEIDGDAWKALHKLISQEYGGLPVASALIDARFRGPVVRRFCEENFPPHVRAVLGYDDLGSGVRQLYRLADSKWSRQDVHLNVSQLKEEIYQDLSRGLPKGGSPDNPFPGYCHFPFSYQRYYFHMLTSEDKVAIDTGYGQPIYRWVKHGRNEALDCRCYALGGIVVMRGERAREKEEENKEGQPYSWSDFWDEVEDMVGQK